MFNDLQQKPPDPENTPETGEIQIDDTPGGLVSWYQVTTFKKVIQLEDLMGNRPEVVNLRDHPELDGRNIIIAYFREAVPGEFGRYVFIGCFLLDQSGKVEKPVILMTGSEDVMSRLLQISDVIAAGEKVQARLSKRGRAWFID